jgi:hypothetical protein
MMDALRAVHTRTGYGDLYGVCRRLALHETETDGESGGVAPVGRSQLADDVGDVKLDGARADVELVGNLRIREALAEKVEYFPLAQGEFTTWWR